MLVNCVNLELYSAVTALKFQVILLLTNSIIKQNITNIFFQSIRQPPKSKVNSCYLCKYMHTYVGKNGSI